MNQWPDAGPAQIHELSGLGEGYSSVAVAEDKVYSAGSVNHRTFVFCFGTNGKLLWKSANGPSWKAEQTFARGYQGTRSTPTVSNGNVYHLSEIGRLTAFDAIDGKKLWEVDYVEQFGSNIPKFGFAESVLIDGDRLYCSPAASKAFTVCLNKTDGTVIWKCGGIPGEAAYNSPVLADIKGAHQLLSMSSSCVFGINAVNGSLLWTSAIKNNRNNNITDPIVFQGNVFVSSGYGRGSKLIELYSDKEKYTASTVWDCTLMDNHHGGVILHEGHFYGSGHKSKGWYCLEAATGKQKWNAKGKGACTFAEGMLYCLEEKGTMKLVTARPDRYHEAGSFKLPRGGKGLYWAHPVVCNGRLYIRHADKLFVYDVRKK